MDFINALNTEPFLQRALMGGVLVALLCAIIGVFITLRKQAFLSDAVAHASLAGVAFALLFSYEPILLALILAVFMAIGITYFRKHSNLGSDTIIGIFYSMLFALGVILINYFPNFRPDLFSYLFGSILAITNEDLIYALITLTVVATFVYVYFQKLLYLTFDYEAAFIRGIKVERLEYILNILSAVVIIISVKVIGIILVTALLLIPAATAKLLASNFKQMLPIAATFSIIMTILGLAASYYLNTPSGATIVLIAGAAYVVLLALKRLI